MSTFAEDLYNKSRPSEENIGIGIIPILKENYNTFFEHLLIVNEQYQSEHQRDWIPDFQRERVWNLQQKQALIVSMLNGLSIGSFYVNKCWTPDKTTREQIDRVLYDGQQRYAAITEFLNGEFPIIVDNKKYFISDLSRKEWRNIINYNVSVCETSFDNLNDLIDFYVLLNKSGVAHSQSDFNKALSFKTT